jgi:MSHA biogenesis protein MshM
MYKAHFGLREAPFQITPDTSFFFSFASYREALNTLLVAAASGEGFIKITGEVGTGKTLLCRKLLRSLDASFVTAYIPNPSLEPLTLMCALADELGVVHAGDGDQHRLLKAINHALLNLARQNKRVLLCIDEAQALPIETLEALRLLSNLETEKRKLLQILLFGQPELDKRLARPEIRQLAQRISFHFRLRPLSLDETKVYLLHRLRVAGFAEHEMFSASGVWLLRFASGGIPRLLNVLAHKSLMLSYGEGLQHVGVRQVLAAVRDTESISLIKRIPTWLRLSMGLLTLGAFSAALILISGSYVR